MILQAFHRHKLIRRMHTYFAMVGSTKAQSRSYVSCEIRSSLAVDFKSKLMWILERRIWEGRKWLSWFLQCLVLLQRHVSLHMSLLLCKLSPCCTHTLGQDHLKLLRSLPIDEVKSTCSKILGKLKGEVTTYLPPLSQSHAEQKNINSQ